MSKGPEASIQRTILDYLAATGVWHIRLNTGAMSGSHNGKRWFVKFGKVGMADILSAPLLPCDDGDHRPHFCWLEIKAPKGKQSDAQKAFQAEVEAAGHLYKVCFSLQDAIEAVGG